MATVVKFSVKGARIFKGDDLVAGGPDTLLNPFIPPGVPPHLWTIKDGRIAPITQAEYDLRNAPKPESIHLKRGPLNGLTVPPWKRRVPWWVWATIAATSAATTYFLV